MQIIDWTKVKKAPVPGTADEGTLLYFRGGGAKVAVFAGSLRVYDADDNLLGSISDSDLTPEETIDATTATSMVKTLAQRAVAKGESLSVVVPAESAPLDLPVPAAAPAPFRPSDSPTTMTERMNIAFMLSGRSRI